MITVLFWCLLALIIGVPIYLLYWNLFRPVLLQRLQYRLYQVRDELRLNVIDGRIDSTEKAYPLVEAFCNTGIAKVQEIDLARLFSKKVDKRIQLETQRDLELIFHAGAPVRQRFLEALGAISGAACANSPGILILLAPIIVFSVTALWFNAVKRWLYSLLTRAVGNLCLRAA